MERGDLAAVAIAILLVVLLTVFLSLPRGPVPVRGATATPLPTTPEPTVLETPREVVTEEPVTEATTPLRVPTRRIFYTSNYYLLPVRFVPGDMAMYGYSDVDWRYNSSVIFAYVEESHGGITETFTVPYPVWRMTATLSSTRTPEKARLRVIVVDENSGQILEGLEIRYPGSMTKTVVAPPEKPLYMVIGSENVERFVITLEAPSEVVG